MLCMCDMNALFINASLESTELMHDHGDLCSILTNAHKRDTNSVIFNVDS